MIFVQGYVHCDPHPGNLLINRTNHGTELVLLDHGLYTVSVPSPCGMRACVLQEGCPPPHCTVTRQTLTAMHSLMESCTCHRREDPPR